MPKLMPTESNELFSVAGPGNFQFSAIRIDHLGASEYTLVTVVCDITGSVAGFSTDLLKMIKAVAAACKKNPRAENLLLRVTLFNHDVGIQEVHGFKLLAEIDPDKDYTQLHPDSSTPLYDATYDAIGATLTYAKQLRTQDFDVNGCVYIITDGDDNASRMKTKHIKEQIDNAKQKETIESLITILVGINVNDPGMKARLDTFHKEADLTQYVDAGSATPQRLAKLANFVSQSISSQSQALGTGMPSQKLVF
jgi:hypothetical protein